jgi:hypothetical protein
VTWVAVPVVIALAFATLPALLYFRNAMLFRPPPVISDTTLSPATLSVLIPARNEESAIAAALESVLESRGVDLEVVVLDDHSEDRTAAIVSDFAARDARVRLEAAPELPVGWCGKQHACYTLSKLATRDTFVFLDADVRLTPDALARLAAFQRKSNAPLVSGFPRQETGTLLEKLVIPLIHWLLLSFLPFDRMRKDLRPSLGAGCGQLFLTTRDAYERVGGHAAIRESLHDGVMLPRAYRAAGLMTDVCDATDLATCRMYRNARQVWFGLAKNAQEGLAAPRLILATTTLLVCGQVLPALLWTVAALLTPIEAALLGVATVASYAPRLHAAWRFRQSWLGAVLHPLGVACLLAIQWFSVLRSAVGRPVGWKGRAHPRQLGGDAHG